MGNALTVVQWNGTAWPSVGPSGFAGVGTNYAVLAFSPTSSAAWVAHQCDSILRKLCVHTWIAKSNWILRGPQVGGQLELAGLPGGQMHAAVPSC